MPAAQRNSSGPWPGLYAELARLETLPPQSGEFDALWNSLRATAEGRERAGLKARNNVEKFRARTILFHLRRLRGLPSDLATEPDLVLDWLPHEAWFATRALRPGLYRVETAVAALDETPAIDPERASWVGRLYDEERAQLEFEFAERLALGLYRRAPDAVNVDRLARVYVWRGNADAARALATEALHATEERAVEARVRLTRARVADALLDLRGALVDYGAALAGENAEAALDRAAASLGEREPVRAAFCARLALATGGAHDEAWTSLGLAWVPAPAREPRPGPQRPEGEGTLSVSPADLRNSRPPGN